MYCLKIICRGTDAASQSSCTATKPHLLFQTKNLSDKQTYLYRFIFGENTFLLTGGYHTLTPAEVHEILVESE